VTDSVSCTWTAYQRRTGAAATAAAAAAVDAQDFIVIHFDELHVKLHSHHRRNLGWKVGGDLTWVNSDPLALPTPFLPVSRFHVSPISFHTFISFSP